MKRPHMRRHAAGPAPLLLDLKGMDGTEPTASMAARFAWLRYALSALVSAIVNRLAVDATSARSSGQSFPVLSVTPIAVMTFVVVPTIAWALTQPCSFMGRPCFASYQRR